MPDRKRIREKKEALEKYLKNLQEQIKNGIWIKFD
jgi:hypothetical protein